MNSVLHIATLSVEALFVVGVILFLFRLRHRVGLIPLAAFLGSNQYLQTILASTHYLEIGGFLISPGSAVLFPSALVAILLVYHKDGVLEARSMILGILISNLTLTLLSLFTSHQILAGGTANLLGVPAEVFQISPRVFLAGTAILLLDAFLIVAVYELVISKLKGISLPARFPLVLFVVMSFDALVFVFLAFAGHPAFREILLSQLVAKAIAGLFYGLVLFVYVRYFDPKPDGLGVGTGTLAILTYRQRYEILRRRASSQQTAFEKERAASQEALNEAHARYQSLFETTTEGILMIDNESGEILEANAALTSLSGYSAASLLGRPFENCNLFDSQTSLSIRTGASGTRETQLFRASREPLAIDLRLTRFPRAGNRSALALGIQDITDRKAAESALRISRDALRERVDVRTRELAIRSSELADSEDRYRDLVENSHDLIQAIGPDGRFLFVNRSWKRALGYSEEEAEQLNFLEIVEPESRGHFETMLQRLEDGETVGLFEAIFVSRDGHTFEVEGNLSCAFEGSRIVSTRGIFRDVSERKAVERFKDQIIATVSHELRTPLTSIIGSLGILAKGSTELLSAKAKKYATIAHRNSKRLLWLVTDILDYEKMEAGLMHVEMAPFDLALIVRESIEDNQGYATRFGVRVTMKEYNGVLLTLVDKSWILQVMANLVSNAIKYSPKASTVEVEIEKLQGAARVSVHDHGQGIPEEFQSQLFKPFSRAQLHDAWAEAGGTGLGLTIAHSAIQRMAGTLDFRTTSGEGSTFFFDLPLLDSGSKPKALEQPSTMVAH